MTTTSSTAAVWPAGWGDLPVATKLYIPAPRPDLVPRPHVTALLNRVLLSRLTLVSAPPGFGKTTLLAEWISLLGSAERPAVSVAWLSLDAADNDPARFWACVIRALQTVRRELGASILNVLLAPQPPPVEAIVAALINEIAHLPDSASALVLVLDDYHDVENQAIHASLTYLLDRLPPQLHVVIATRADPLLPLARYRARGQLVEIGADDLRFSTTEATSLFDRLLGGLLSAADVEALTTRTEGWIAGLQLAALSLQGRPAESAADFVGAFSGSHHYVLDYLVEEVLDRQPPEVQEFLLHTSVLGRLTGPLCDAVTGHGDGQAMLERLARANLFLVPLDDERRWYRYHRLFADLLRARLHRQDPDRAAGLHVLASVWLADEGLAAEAVSHALAAEDYERAAQLLERHGNELLSRGELTTLLGWMAALPAELMRRRPGLCINRAWAHTFGGHLEQVEPLLDTAAALVGAHDSAEEVARDVLGSAACIRAVIATMAGDVERAIDLVHEADRLLAPDRYLPRSIIPFTLGVAQRGAGHFDLSAAAFADVVRLGEAAGNIWTVAVGLYEMATSRRLQGRLREAADLLHTARQRAAECGAQTFGSLGKLDIGLSEVLCEQNQLDAADRLATRGLEQMASWASPSDLMLAYLSLIQVRAAQGAWPAAEAALRQADDLRRSRPVFPRLSALVDVYRIRLALAQGRLDEAADWARSAQPGEHGTAVIREAELITLVRVRLSQQEPAAALELLAGLERSAREGGRVGALIEIRTLQAVALHALHETPRALAALWESLALAEPEGYVRVFLQVGEPMGQLLRLGLREWASGSAPQRYARHLLTALGTGLPELSAPHVGGVLVEPLSERELEVLRLIADGLSNQEIADRLFISIRTVKKHAQNTNAKLGAASRTRAVARARDLNLL